MQHLQPILSNQTTTDRAFQEILVQHYQLGGLGNHKAFVQNLVALANGDTYTAPEVMKHVPTKGFGGGSNSTKRPRFDYEAHQQEAGELGLEALQRKVEPHAGRTKIQTTYSGDHQEALSI